MNRASREILDGYDRPMRIDPVDGRPGLTLRLTPASQIKPRPVHWLSQDRIAVGTLCLIGGREGIGKSVLVDTWAADITKGRLQGVYLGVPKAVVIAATEDSWEHTIVPRLMAADADLSKVYRVDAYTDMAVETAISLPRDLGELARLIDQANAAAVILDPLLSRLDAALDSHKDAEVRTALEPLVRMADAANVAVIGLIHVNKGGSNDALSALMGSRAFVAVARSVLFVCKDPDNDSVRMLGQPKNNLGKSDDLPTLTYRVVGAKVAETDEGDVWTGKLEWLGQTDRTIHDAIEQAAETAGDKTATSEAADWLKDYLTDQSGPVESAVIKRDAAKAGHSREALRRARARLPIRTESLGFPRRTFWALLSSGVTAGRLHATVSTVPTVSTGSVQGRPQLERESDCSQWAQSARSAQSEEVSTADRTARCAGCEFGCLSCCPEDE